MWMLQQEMGRDNILAGLRAFIGKYNPDPDFPVLQDMLAVLRGFAPDTAAFEAFTDQWFHDVVVPEYEFEDVTKTLEPAAGTGADTWVVPGTIQNVGSGEVTVEVAATAGERWSAEGGDRRALPRRAHGGGAGRRRVCRVRDPRGVRAGARAGRPGRACPPTQPGRRRVRLLDHVGLHVPPPSGGAVSGRRGRGCRG